MAWICIASFTSLDDAYIVKGMLETNGIPTELSNTTLATVYPLTDTWTPIELRVPESFVAEARQLMQP